MSNKTGDKLLCDLIQTRSEGVLLRQAQLWLGHAGGYGVVFDRREAAVSYIVPWVHAIQTQAVSFQNGHHFIMIKCLEPCACTEDVFLSFYRPHN